MRIHSAVLALGLAAAFVSTSAHAASDNDRLSAIEQQLAVLQRELSNFEARAQQAPAPKPATAASAPASSGTANALSWPLADSALGLDVSGVTSDGNAFVVNRAWLASELTLIRLPGRAPAFAATPGGVAVRAVKPKTLAAKLGLQNADTIVAVDDQPVHTLADISAALHAAKGDRTKLKLLRKKQTVEQTYQLSD